MRLRGAISCALGCPYQGEVPADAVADVVRRMRDLGCDEIDIADTIGVGTPLQVQAIMQRAAQDFRSTQLSGHFHDTYGQAHRQHLRQPRSRRLDLPFLGGRPGRLPVRQGRDRQRRHRRRAVPAAGLGIDTGIDLDAVVDAGQFISRHLGRKSVSRAGNALAAKRAELNRTSAVAHQRNPHTLRTGRVRGFFHVCQKFRQRLHTSQCIFQCEINICAMNAISAYTPSFILNYGVYSARHKRLSKTSKPSFPRRPESRLRSGNHRFFPAQDDGCNRIPATRSGMDLSTTYCRQSTINNKKYIDLE